jgi:hypothetical protein
MASVQGRCGTFDVGEAIRLIISTAARAGIPVELNSAVASLRTAFPQIAMSDTALRNELLNAADGAQIECTVRPKRQFSRVSPRGPRPSDYSGSRHSMR